MIGLAGGVGSGKSTVAAEFGKLGCLVIDADRLGHEFLRRQTVKKRLARAFGASIFASDGSVERGRLAKLVFGHPRALARLDKIMHPAMLGDAKRTISLAGRDKEVSAVVLDAAALFEAGWDDLCSHLVFIQATKGKRLKRVASERGWSGLELQRREKSQISLDKKRRNCCYTICNSSDLSSLRRRVRRLFDTIIHAEKRARLGR
ncbi:MAG: dephospho-CoA kinase [Planctomycetes bacterium]|nr:dephospho-CoA kinase [Planctomycetota bacterium]